MKKIIETKQAPAPIGPYSQAVQAGEYLFLSGQIAIDPSTGELNDNSIEEETHQVMKNVMAVLKEADADFGHVVKTTIFLKRMSDFVEVNKVYGSYFTSHFPARETVEVSGLPKNVNVEISMTVYKA